MNEQVPGEIYNINDRIKAYVLEVAKNSRGVPQMLISRTHPGFVRRLVVEAIELQVLVLLTDACVLV